LGMLLPNASSTRICDRRSMRTGTGSSVFECE
jgi:hypothetical protein